MPHMHKLNNPRRNRGLLSLFTLIAELPTSRRGMVARFRTGSFARRGSAVVRSPTASSAARSIADTAASTS